MRNLFISMDTTENHPSVLAQLARRRNDSMRKQKFKADALMKMIKPKIVALSAGGGVTLAAFDLNEPLVDRFLERVCRGVLYVILGRAYFPANFEWGKGRLGSFAELPSSIPQRHVGSVFSCTASSDGYFVALDFYAGFPVWGKFSHD